MSTNKPTYTREFQENAVRLALKGEKSKAAIARELGIPEWKIRDWVRSYMKAAEKSGDKPALDEFIFLQKQIRELRLENEILKKAAAYFAKTLK
jgi:transposase